MIGPVFLSKFSKYPNFAHKINIDEGLKKSFK
jgi:hypothetical protein